MQRLFAEVQHRWCRGGAERCRCRGAEVKRCKQGKEVLNVWRGSAEVVVQVIV
jgi:hypothetical protein